MGVRSINWLALTVVGVVLGGLCGCAAGRIASAAEAAPAATTSSATRPAATTTAPALDPRAALTLEQIAPAPRLAEPATQPATRPSLDALELYGRARDELLKNQRFSAIDLLDQAARIDPYSFEIQYTLGRAWLGTDGNAEKAAAAFERAAALRPDDLDVHLALGRQQLPADRVLKAVEQFRLARLTTEYAQDEDAAALVDFFLARALQQGGYLQAALDQYVHLRPRLQRTSEVVRGNPELTFLLGRPELLQLQIAELQEKLNRPQEALDAYRKALESDPLDMELYRRIVRVLTATGKTSEAAATARSAVAVFHANADSLALLRDVYRHSGRESEMVDELAQLRRQRPDDQALLFAYVDALSAAGRGDEAEKVLASAARDSGYDFEIVRRLVDRYESRSATTEAAAVLVEALAQRPDTLRQLSPLWSRLLQFSRPNRLRLSDLQQLQVSPGAEAARLFWLSRVADLWNRDALARHALDQAAWRIPPFAPACRIAIGQYWQREDWDEAQKLAACEKLSDSVERSHAPALAEELRGLTELNRGRFTQAIEHFTAAQTLGNRAPDLLLNQALALKALEQHSKAEQVLWKIVSDHPGYEDAYGLLFRTYLESRSPAQAVKVLQTWLSADPNSENARLLQATVYMQAGKPDAAEQVLLGLQREDPDNMQTLMALQGLYSQTGKLDQFVASLEDRLVKHPENRAVVEMLVRIYSGQKRLTEASRVLDAARGAVGQDTDLLYYIASLYTRIDQKKTTEEILRQVVKLDPKHSAASNDLGYSWADQGEHLDQAERLIRVAVEAEPDNQAFLDSLGWVLYKRGEFDQAHHYLKQAIGEAARPDPVVLDHLADSLYRLDRRDEAVKTWQRSLDRLAGGDDDREDVKQLRLQLMAKLKQAGANQPVTVAPTAEQAGATTRSSSRPAQARNSAEDNP